MTRVGENRSTSTLGHILVFRSVGTLRPLYQHLARDSVRSVSEQIASFLGRQITRNCPENRLHFPTRSEDLHQTPLRSSSIRLTPSTAAAPQYETTLTDVSFFQAHASWNIGRRDAGPRPRKKTISA